MVRAKHLREKSELFQNAIQRVKIMIGLLPLICATLSLDR